MQQVIQNIRTGKRQVTSISPPIAGHNDVLIVNQASLVSAGTEKMVMDLAKKSLLGKARERPDQVRRVLEKIKNEGLMHTISQVRQKLDEPIVMGYSSAGFVVACGDDVQEFKPGDRVASNGPHAEVVSVPRNLCAEVPDNVPFEHAAFTVLGSIALQGVRLAKCEFGETVFVIGLGLVGQLTVALLKAAGMRVMGTDLDPERCALAVAMGAEFAKPGISASDVESATRGLGADAVVITASTKSNKPIELAAGAVRKKGRVVLVGVVGLELDRRPWFFKEAEFVVSCSYGPGRYDPDYEDRGHDYPAAYVRWTEQRNMQAVLDMMGSGRLDVSPLVSHRFDIAEAEKAYQLIESGSEPYLGIVMRYPELKGRTLYGGAGAAAAAAAAAASASASASSGDASAPSPSLSPSGERDLEEKGTGTVSSEGPAGDLPEGADQKRSQSPLTSTNEDGAGGGGATALKGTGTVSPKGPAGDLPDEADQKRSQSPLTSKPLTSSSVASRRSNSERCSTVGVLGAGNFARMVLLPAIKKSGKFQIVNICSAKGVSANHAASTLGIPQTCTDEDVIFQDPAIDTVFSITRHDHHARHVLKAIQAGKNIFVEKPLCLTVEELSQIEHAVADRGDACPAIMVGFNRRFSPAAAKVREFFAGVKTPLTVSFRFNAGAIPADHWTQHPREGGGRIIGEACHGIDFATMLLGPPVRVYAESVKSASAGITDDQAFLTLRHASGGVSNIAYISSGDKAFPKERIEIIGGNRIAVVNDFKSVDLCFNGSVKNFKLPGQDKGHFAEIGMFGASVLDGRNIIPWGELRAVTAASILAVRSLREGCCFEI